MKYRNFGENDWEISILGFGAMRLPLSGTGEEEIDVNRAVTMIQYAIDNGVNYVDTAWPYHKGESEKVVARALKNGYREKVKLATKLPTWELENPEDMDKYLDKQLAKLEVDTIDCYLLHALNGERWDKYKNLNVGSWVDRIKKQGKIDHIGFSFHGEYEVFEKIIDEFNWDFCQIQYNYLDTEYQAGRKGLKYAADRGLPVIIMEPLRGGKLAADPPQTVQEILKDASKERTPAEWALQWLWNQPEITTVLSGMSTLEQVKENIESASRAEVNSLSDRELEIIEHLKSAFRPQVDCTRCNYCMPCPSGVNIPQIFSLYNDAILYDDFQEQKKKYQDMEAGARASACIECARCESACPQKLPIIKLLKDVEVYFSQEKS
ncbi:MAG: aldo/keto reductase [Halanaerobiaceae bacterium]